MLSVTQLVAPLVAVQKQSGPEGQEIFAIAAQRDGVAARIEITPRWLGLSSRVRAWDRQGRELEARRGFWSSTVTCIDTSSGISTQLDTASLKLDINSPVVRTTTVKGPWLHVIERQSIQQSVTADGSMTVRTERVKEWDERKETPRWLPQSRYRVTEQCLETSWPLGEKPTTQKVILPVSGLGYYPGRKYTPGVVRQEVKTRLEPGGCIAIHPDGEVSRLLPLFVSPAFLTTVGH